MNAFDLLTDKPVTIEPTDSIDEAIRRMERFNIRHLPVVQGREVVGLIGDGDILLLIGQVRGGDGAGAARGADRPVPDCVGQIMSAPVRTIGSDLDLGCIVELLISHRFSALPVVDGEGLLLGMVTKTDLLRWYCGFCQDHPTNPSATCSVRSRMQHNVRSVQEDDPAQEAYRRMVRTGLRHMPVMSGGKLVGMVSDRDLRRALGKTARKPRDREPSAGYPRGGAPVAAIMTPKPRTIEPDQTMARATELMLDHRIGALPVVTADTLVGIITGADVLRLIRALVVCAAA